MPSNSSISKTYKSRVQKEADDIVSKGLATLQAMEASMATHFPYTSLSAAQQAYESNDEVLKQNTALLAALSATRDALEMATSHASLFQNFITLHVPQMEDGNNFGVTVQLAVLKEINDLQEKWTKALDELPKYYSSRADAVDKLGILSSTTRNETKSTSTAQVSGSNKEEENGSKTTTTATSETKTSSSPMTTDYYRIQHVHALDVAQYATLKAAFTSVYNGYMVLLDTMDKNQDKLQAPKGSGGSNFGAMY